MGGNQNVAWNCLQESETLFKICGSRGILLRVAVFKTVGGDGTQAVRINHVVTDRAFTRFPRPTRSARSVPWSQVRRNDQFADSEAFTLSQFLDVLDGSDRG